MNLPNLVNYFYIIGGAIASLIAIITALIVIQKYKPGRQEIVRVVLVAACVVSLIGAASVYLASRSTDASSSFDKGSPTPTSYTTPTPPNISDGQHLYEQIILGKTPNWADNLDNPANPNGWTITSGEPTGCLIQTESQDNKNYYYAYSHTPGYVDTCFSRQRYTNFGYQAHMTVRSGDGGGLIFRSAKDDYNSAMDRFDIRPQQQVFDILVEKDNAKRTNSACDSNGDAYCYNQVINKTGENTLAVIADGNILYFYINGTCVAGVKDTTNSSGLIGVFAVDAQHSTNVAFDSAEVWNLP